MNKYTKVRKIGEGSFGTAMLVKSKQNGRQMVIKEINMGRMGRKEREESRKEVAVLAQLNHPNIVTYKESFEELGSLYIVMDYCDGGDLYSRINTQRGVLFTEDQILDWFVQICLSIKHIHDRKILHRDIKSQNIFLTRAGMVKLGDFGIAKVLNSTVELARTCIGTPYYLSPEICENKPYNNKSDVWSLGCVVYEMCTLKHAFEAGNMKNLVLKIIRGSYPPLPTKYSYELRGLVAQLFKRNPRDRPSINAILRKPLLQNRIKKFLNHVELADEFSHTVMHGCQVKKVLSPGRNQPQPIRASPRPKPSPSPTPAYRPATPVRQRAAGMSPKYNPASVYGAPQQSPARKSRENRVRKSSDSSGEGKRPNSAASDLARRRQELIDAEKRRRDAAKKEYANAHQALQAKQQMQKYNKDREKGWKNLVDSLGSDDSTPACAECAPMKEVQNYEHYHDVLNKLERDRNKPKKIQNEAAQEYLQRKREAAEYKARGRADLWGGGGVAAAISPRVLHKPPSVYNARDKQEQDYLAKLRQIRLQNFNERRNNKAGDNQQKVFKDQNSDLRRKKIEALREQADERAKKLKAELEKKRKMIGGPPPGGAVPAGGGGGGGGAGVVYLKKEDVKPAPALPMTAAMQAIGAKPAQPVKASEKVNIGLTAAMNAIGAVAPSAPSPTSPVSPSPAPVTPTPVTSAGTPTSANSQDRSEIQKKKETILKRLNSKSKEGAIGAESNKSKWADTYDKRLRELSLEETASNMEATSAADVVIKYTDKPAVPRKSWGVPAAGEAVPQIATQLTDTASSTASKTDTGTISLGSSEGGGSDVAGTSSPPSTNSRGDEATATDVHDKNIQEQQKDATITVLSSGDPGVKDLPKVNNLPRVKDTQDKEKLVEEEDDSTPDGNENGEDSQGEEAPKLTWAQKAAEVGKQGTFVSGLSTGQFDVKNVEVLRTCSEPDLLRLFATNFSPLSSLDEKQKTRRLSLGDDNDETLTELDLQALKATYKGESSNSYSTSSSDSLEDTHTQISEDIEEEVEADEEEVDEDLLTVRQSMMDILQEEEEEPLSALKIAKSKRKTKKTLTTKKKPKKKSKKKTIVAEMDDGNRTAEGIQTMKETLASLLQPQQQSDSDSDEYFEDGSMFSELEEKRANLEEQLGCDVFRKAYKTVQAIHDNEDENMSEGIQLISDMLGPHNHLYPSILQLVMADGVFTEDND